MANSWTVAATAGVLLALAAPAPAAADQIGVGMVTCINPHTSQACTGLSSGSVWWRVLNLMGGYDSPYPGSNDILDVTLEFRHEGGTSIWHWDRLAPAAPGVFGETPPFDASLLRGFQSLHLEATLARAVFDPLYPESYIKFVADSARVSATSTVFPPPLDVFAEGQLVANPVPEPASMLLAGLGLGALAAARRRRAHMAARGSGTNL